VKAQRTNPVRIRLSRAKGWRLPEGAVVVARPGKWGNPFVVGRDGTRIQCVAMFAILASGFIAIVEQPDVDAQLDLWRRLRGRSIKALAGRDLACWCPLDGPCHADVLLWLANGDRAHPLADVEIELPRIRIGMAARSLLKARARKAAVNG
jgi:hypothetical protein